MSKEQDQITRMLEAVSDMNKVKARCTTPTTLVDSVYDLYQQAQDNHAHVLSVLQGMKDSK